MGIGAPLVERPEGLTLGVGEGEADIGGVELGDGREQLCCAWISVPMGATGVR